MSVDDVLLIHADQIARYGGESGLRDRGLLESAVAAPRASFGGALLHPDLVAQAAAYLFHIVRNHPFVDGNKRTGAAAALVFLLVNGVALQLDDHALVRLVRGVALGTVTKASVTRRLRAALDPA